METIPGTLFIVATPLGNLEDMTFRAVRTLKEAALIAAEDTRHSKKLLAHYQISTPTISCHEHNEARRAEKLVETLKQGKDVALISDAGTPCISDPGYRLVTAVLTHGIRVVPIPGCSAAVTGLSAAGLPTDRFLFAGFLPKKQQQQRKVLQDLATETATLIFYESPRRVDKLIRQLLNVLGDRQACVARELTKRHEEFMRGPLSDILSDIRSRESLKGECSVFVAGRTNTRPELGQEDLEKLIRSRLDREDMPTSTLARDIADQYQLPKKRVYETILQVKADC